MAARALASAPNSGVSGHRKPPVGKRFVKGQSGNPGGLSSEQRAAADAQRALAQAHGAVLLPDGRSRVHALLDSILHHGLEGSAPHAQLYLAYTVGKPQDNVRIDGDVSLSIRKRVYHPIDSDDIAGDNG